MKNNFLYQIAKKVYEIHHKELGSVCMVFPNKRAGLFFSRYLSEITDKPVWSPVFMTIRELMQEFSDLQIADPLYLIFELYKCFRQEKKSTESFDEFYRWGEMLLGDFDEVDKYLVSANELFRNLSDLKEIEERFSDIDKEQIEVIKKFWKWFEPGKRSEHKEEFVSLWEVLFNIYSVFKNKISNDGLAYEGMLYRQVAEKILTGQNLELKYSSYIIVGFNALNRAEERLFEYLRDSGKAAFYWDWDKYYLGEGKEFREAGFFISKNKNKYPSAELDVTFNSMLDKNKKIEFIGVPSEIGQTKILEQIFREYYGEIKGLDHKTAIVLPDEHLLMPVIYSLPEEISSVNITMGYPVRNTPVYGLVCNLIELQDSQYYRSGKAPVFYYKNVLSILYSHYIQNVAGEEVEKIKKNINSKNIIYWSPGNDVKNKLLQKIFTPVKKVDKISSYLIGILEYFHNQETDEEKENSRFSILEREYVYNVYTSIKRLNDVISAAKGINFSLEIYYRLLNRYMRDMRIPFSGEPLSGLQIMGILETRTLDFENVVILSMNEGIFPGPRPRYSFIPYNLRKGFSLPTIEHQDSIYAYYFYRLIQRAGNVTLIYDTSSGGLKTGEMSRFLTQMKYDKEIKVKERILGYKFNIEKSEPIRVFKTEKTLKVLSKYIIKNNRTDKYISPTALNTYLDCSLKFYFKYIAQLKEPDEVIEEIDPMIFGNLLHHSVNLLYKPYVGKTVNSRVIGELIKDRNKIRDYVTRSFYEVWLENDADKRENVETSGKSMIIRDVLIKYVSSMLEADLKYAPFMIIGLEKFHSLDIPFSYKGNDEKVRVGGNVDRIDMVNKAIRVIDYKTGATENNIRMISELFKPGDKDRQRAVLQTFVYALMLKRNWKNVAVIPGIYCVRQIQNKNFDYKIFIKEGRNSKNPIIDISNHETDLFSLLKNVIDEIYNTAIPFRQVNEPDICKYCNYKQFCVRDS